MKTETHSPQSTQRPQRIIFLSYDYIWNLVRAVGWTKAHQCLADGCQSPWECTLTAHDGRKTRLCAKHLEAVRAEDGGKLIRETNPRYSAPSAPSAVKS